MRGVHYVLILIIVLAFFGGFPAYMALGQIGTSQTVTVTVTAQPVFGPLPDDGVEEGWGGGIAGRDEEVCPIGGTSTAGRLTSGGLVIQPITVVSFDGRLCLTIDLATVIITPNGLYPRCIGIYEMTTPPSPPEGACIIGCMYDAFPDGAIFLPPATLQCSYHPKDIPEGIAGDCLVIACCDQTSGQWIELDCVVDSEANIITAEVSQFFDPVILGYETMPTPAVFEIISLHISPAEVEIGETVNITVMVANTGGQPGSYQVVLRINSVAEADGEIAINAGASQQVSFTTSQDTPGLYLVEVNGLTGSFEVIEPPALVEPVNWWLIGGIIAAVAIIAFVTFILRRMMLS